MDLNQKATDYLSRILSDATLSPQETAQVALDLLRIGDSNNRTASGMDDVDWNPEKPRDIASPPKFERIANPQPQTINFPPMVEGQDGWIVNGQIFHADHAINCPPSCDSKAEHLAMRESAKIKQDMKQPFVAPVLTEYGKALLKNTVSPSLAKCRNCQAICEDNIEGLCSECSKMKRNEKPKPMTLERAVEVLNERKFANIDNWERTEFDGYDDNQQIVTGGSDLSPFSMPSLAAFAIAEKLECEQ